MPRVTLVAADGIPAILEITEGKSVMQGAVAAGLDGIVAECGGELVCATCHVYVRPGTCLELLPAISELETEMLGHTIAERRETSRLSCRLVLSAGHDGLVVDLPAAQV